jgi:uncharacterized damage-inducible protein DinB
LARRIKHAIHFVAILNLKMKDTHFLESIQKLFRYYRSLGDKAMRQLTEAELSFQPQPESNNIATIVKHMHGNMLSRWTDFLTSDGEKPWRQRDQEFEDTLRTRSEIEAAWKEGWDCLFAAIDPLKEDDLSRIVYIRNEGHTVQEALHRQLAHYSYHVGQIVYLARLAKSGKWESLSIPKGQSERYNQQKFEQEKEKRHFTDKV